MIVFSKEGSAEKMSKHFYDVIVIGAGIAGLTATCQVLRNNPSLSVANLESQTVGGLVLNINELDGTIKGAGIDLASSLSAEAIRLGAQMLAQQAISLSSADEELSVTTAEGAYSSKTAIIASGAALKKVGVPGEQEFEFKGVSHCASCDGPLFGGETVVVAGGGDSALQEAHVLSKFCRTVHVVNCAPQLTAKRHLIEAVQAANNIRIRCKAEIVAIRGDKMLEAVEIRNLTDGSTSETPCAGFFAYIGLTPSAHFVPDTVARDAEGFLVTDRSMNAARNLFAVGAVRSGYGGMLKDAVAEAEIAANKAAKLVSGSFH